MPIPLSLPMPADFLIRLAGGLGAMLLLAPWRIVPPAFFRTHCLVMLGLMVGAALVEGRDGPAILLWGTIGGAVLAFLASVLWGLGLPIVARPMTAILALLAAALIVITSFLGFAPGWRFLWFWVAGSRLSSALLMGSTLTAMLLGHHYLTAPAMTIAPLRRFVVLMAASLAIRTIFAGLPLATWMTSGVASSVSGLFLAMRWGMGVLGPILATVLAWKTVQIRSTQSATGILYIAMTLVLFGELAGLILGRDAGIEF